MREGQRTWVAVLLVLAFCAASLAVLIAADRHKSPRALGPAPYHRDSGALRLATP